MVAEVEAHKHAFKDHGFENPQEERLRENVTQFISCKIASTLLTHVKACNQNKCNKTHQWNVEIRRL